MTDMQTHWRPEPQGNQTIDLTALFAAADAAARAIPPTWPLASSVAVNPYLGQTNLDLAQTAALVARVAGAPVTMPRSWYRERLACGAITMADLAGALSAADPSRRPGSIAFLKTAALKTAPPRKALPNIADLAAEASDIDWPGVIAARFGAWAAGYLDAGQALWAAPQGKSAFSAWKAVATHDLTPEIVGLTGFAAFAAAAPERATDALATSAVRLALAPNAMQTYFHSLLITLGGWAQMARFRLWEAKLAGQGDDTITDFLSIRLLWEHTLFESYEQQIGEAWAVTMAAHERPVEPDEDQVIDAILQDASERAAQRALGEKLSRSKFVRDAKPVVLQAAFCIDVRSEVFRRALESVDTGIQTLGFAGFFGLAASHHRFASDVAEHRLPVLLRPGFISVSGSAANADADRAARLKARATRAWGRFKLAAVSSFAFVEATGPVYVGKLIRDALGLPSRRMAQEPRPRFLGELDVAARVKLSASILQAMSLTKDFAPLVLLVGHGANVVNNPHASGLDCGACGGYSGEVNARLLAGLLNDLDVRTGLGDLGIAIPAATVFVGALHDTTTDSITLYDADLASSSHRADIDRARTLLAQASVLARSERVVRFPGATGARSLETWSRDWSETRPEWGLAGCNAFIAAPRSRTIGVTLAGRAFLHEYDWRCDDGFAVLELIMTAPVVVASWISLQYYGSSVSPELFGGGNKLLHNVVGGIGVVEGNGGPLRAGLPWQSVCDGRQLVHDPLRLTVCIEAPREAMSEILERHAEVRALFDNRWLHLFALDEAGAMAWRYSGDLNWESVPGTLVSAQTNPPSSDRGRASGIAIA